MNDWIQTLNSAWFPTEYAKRRDNRPEMPWDSTFEPLSPCKPEMSLTQSDVEKETKYVQGVLYQGVVAAVHSADPLILPRIKGLFCSSGETSLQIALLFCSTKLQIQNAKGLLIIGPKQREMSGIHFQHTNLSCEFLWNVVICDCWQGRYCSAVVWSEDIHRLKTVLWNSTRCASSSLGPKAKLNRLDCIYRSIAGSPWSHAFPSPFRSELITWAPMVPVWLRSVMAAWGNGSITIYRKQHLSPHMLGTPTAASASVSMGFADFCGAFRISSSRRSQVREVASCRPGIRRRGHTSGVAQRQNTSWTELNCDIWHHLTSSEDPWNVLGAKTRTPTSADPHGQSHLWLLDCLSGTQRHRGFNWFQ